MNFKEYIKNFCLVSIPTFVVIFLFFECVVFRLIIPVSDAQYYTFDERFDILKLDVEGLPSEGQYSQGPYGKHRIWWKINSDGWMSDIEYLRGAEENIIAVVGDSYIEARQVNTGQAYPQLLNQKFGDSVAVYGFGISGAPLSNYLQMCHYVQYHFNPDVIVINLVHNDFFESLIEYRKLISGQWYWTMKEENDSWTMQKPAKLANTNPGEEAIKRKGIGYGLQQFATYRYVKYNFGPSWKLFFKKARKRNVQYESNIDVKEDLVGKNKVRSMTDYLMLQFKREFPNKRLVFVMDAPRMAIYEEAMAESKVVWLNELVKEVSAKYGLEFIDLTHMFEKDFKKNNVNFEFETDGHWNAYAHQLVADTIFNYISQQRQE